MTAHILDTRAGRFFWKLTRHPKKILALGLLFIVFGAAFMPTLQKDTTTEAFVPDDEPVLIYRDKVKETFGLKDPMVLAVVNQGPDGVFTPHTLQLVHWLTERVADIEGVNYDRVTSLATENDIIGTEDGMIVEPFFDEPPATQYDADRVREAVMDFPLYVGSLVGREGTATLIVVELLNDQEDAPRIYEELLALAEEAPTDGEEIYVAGEGAVSGYLASYIDADAQRLNPLAALIITLVLIVAFRTVRGAVLPNLMVLATLAAAFGTMAATGVPFFVITNGMVVILIGIAVADGLHILSEYYEQHAEYPKASSRELVTRTMVKMWRPVLITSVTTAAGFMGLYLSSYMPPMKYFGLFSAYGVMAALFFAEFVIPAGLTLLKPRPSRAFRSVGGPDLFARGMDALGRFVLRRPYAMLAATAFVAAAGVIGALQLEANEDRIRNFQQTEPIVLADAVLNEVSDGTSYLDIVVETPEAEGLFEPAHLRKIEALQRHLETLPHVQGSTSIVDFLKQMNRSLNEDRPEAYVLPDEADLVAQYFLLYSASGDPTDFEEYIDYDYRLANVRFRLNSGLFSDQKIVTAAAQQYLDEQFNTPDLKATLSGSVTLTTQWIGQLAENHFRGMIIALLAVMLMAAVAFRSFVAGIYTVLPVMFSLLLIYAVMGFGEIWLGIGTSMFAAISIGVGVDFAVHTIDRLRLLVRDGQQPLKDALRALYPSTGRALLFNFAALALGFSALLTSSVPPLARFGGLVIVSVAASFLASLTFLPAFIYVTRPAFLGLRRRKPALVPATVTAMLLVGLLLPATSSAQTLLSGNGPLPSGDEIAERINARDDGEHVVQRLKMTLIDKRGKTRERETRTFRKDYGAERHTVLFYERPTNVKGTGFLTYDYPDPEDDDDQWLYLPALRKSRRIAASDRGDYFLGTDLTYEDIKLAGRVSIEDYVRTTLREDTLDGRKVYVLEAIPIDDKTAKELGYGKVISWIDAEIWMARKSAFWDPRGKLLKTAVFKDIRLVQGIWTQHRIEVENHKAGHRTVFEFSDVDYESAVDDDLFTERALRRGR